MSDIDKLTHLITQCHGLADVHLQPVHHFEMAGRGVYRIDRATGNPWLMRAYHQEIQNNKWLVQRAETLLFLEQVTFPAPRVLTTVKGALVGRYGDWSALVVTFIEGKMACGSLQDFYDIGATLSLLHRLTSSVDLRSSPLVPPSRWQPPSKIAGWISQLIAIASEIPSELHGLYKFSLTTLQRVIAWPDLPAVILHTDCWANNAIRTPEGQMILIDWDGAGWGPAILDLGYLLVACHAFLPEWPQITPNAERIGAVMAGYQQEWAITAVERDLLVDAVCFAEAFRAAQWLPEAISGDWRQHNGLMRFHARYPIAIEIAHQALHCLV